MVTIVPWRVTGIEAGPIWDAIYGVETQDRDEGKLPTFVPARDSSILRDGDDATYVDLDKPGGSEARLLYGQVTTTSAIPEGEPEWVRLTIRWGVLSGEAGIQAALYTYRSDSWDDTPVSNGNVSGIEAGTAGMFGTEYAGSHTPADGIITDVWEIPRGIDPDYAEMDNASDPSTYAYAYNDGDLTGWPGPFDMFRRGEPSTIWLSWLQAEARPLPTDPTDIRIYDILVEVAYPGSPEWPLRQIQRDDHLAPGGTIRASTGTSRQGSIRARGYE